MQNLRILVPTDFSELSNKAFEAAEVLVESFGGVISPFHVYMNTEDVYALQATHQFDLSDNYKNIAEGLLERLNDTAERFVNVKYLGKGKTTVGFPATCILEEAEHHDLIVISSHGRTGFSRLFMGSVAEKVLRLSKIPVLVVEENSKIKPLKKILVTTDFSESSMAAFPWAYELAKVNDAEIDLVNVISFEQTSAVGFYNRSYEESLKSGIEEKLKAMINEHFHDIKDNVKSRLIESCSSAHKSLAVLVESSHYDMIIMATVGHSGLDYMLLGSTTASLVRQVETAVLVVHP